jgi:hypothetical protein
LLGVGGGQNAPVIADAIDVLGKADQDIDELRHLSKEKALRVRVL